MITKFHFADYLFQEYGKATLIGFDTGHDDKHKKEEKGKKAKAKRRLGNRKEDETKNNMGYYSDSRSNRKVRSLHIFSNATQKERVHLYKIAEAFVDKYDSLLHLYII